MKTLIVEDDFVSRFVLQKMLSVYGKCDIAINGYQALQAYDKAINEGKPYDLICLDIMMPELDGRDTLKVIRQKEKESEIIPKNEVKILMISALDTPSEVINAYYSGGCTSYLVKPFSKEDLLTKLDELGLVVNSSELN